jgi:hypothetical protein
MIAAMTHGFLGIDGYEHISVIRELATHPFSPQNPIILSDVPHAFFSPYHVFLGYFSAITTFSAERTLEIFGVLNTILVLAGLYRFCDVFFKGKTDIIATYSLLLILFFWKNSLEFSAFFDWYSWRYCWGYPSTFAFGLLLWGAVWIIKWMEEKDFKYLIITILTTSILFLTHPTTAISYCVIGFSLSLAFTEKIEIPNIIRINGAIFMGIFICFLYPYYSFFELIKTQSPEFHLQSKRFYGAVWEIFGSLIVVAPFLLIRLKEKKMDTLLIAFLLLLCIYGYGSVSEKFGYGRVIAIMAIIIQLHLAHLLSRIEEYLQAEKSLRYFLFGFVLCAVLVHKSQVENISAAFQMQINGDWAKNMGKTMKQYDVFLVPTPISLYVTAFGGKAVSSCHPLYYVPDIDRRNQLVDFFYSADTSNVKREVLLKDYKVNYILLNRKWETENANLYQFVKSKAIKEFDLGGEVIMQVK